VHQSRFFFTLLENAWGFQSEEKANRNLMIEIPMTAVFYPLRLLNFTHIYNSRYKLSGIFVHICLNP